MHRILDAGLLFLHLGLGRRSYGDHRDAAGELRQPLLQLLPVVIGGRRFDLLADLVDATLDVFDRACALDDRRDVLGDDDLLGAAEILELDALELDAEILGDVRAAGQDGDVL